ncbi:hypothetical protein PL263_04990 [Methylomonas sp. EFPC3]|uniref:hypothetical protein n=1 Tax=Methylomonas sp. EFPC3 TaxID=3021710 RepID=UPI002416994B|nr:hypothetical protein [Methylomonas sp. EFPC3]WFP51385.1 hypothetical protein PL263_04990 [Methylomonas sp. EFPC3]
MIAAKHLLTDNVRILKSEVSKTTYQGVAIALLAIVCALLALSFYYTGEISFAGIIVGRGWKRDRLTNPISPGNPRKHWILAVTSRILNSGQNRAQL